MSILLSLPVEILQLIFAARKEDPQPLQWQRDLLSIIHSCRRLYDLALPVLYASPRTSYITSSMNLYRVLRADATKAALVKEVCFTCIPIPRLEDEARLQKRDILPSLLPNCKKMFVCATEGTGHTTFAAISEWAGRCPKLRALSINQLDRLGEETRLDNSIKGLPDTLQTLSLYSASLYQDEWDRLWSLCHPWLHSLRVRRPYISTWARGRPSSPASALAGVQVLGPCLHSLSCIDLGF